MSEGINTGKTLYSSPEEAFNAIIDSINQLDKRLENLTIAFNDNVITDTSRFAVLSKILNFTSDDILDFYNLVKKEERAMKERINSRVAG